MGEGDIAFALHFFGNRCCYCGQELTRTFGKQNQLEMEHFYSLSEQDDDDLLILNGTVGNLVPSCRTCNRKKSDSNPEEWTKKTFANHEEIINNILFYFSLIEGDE